MTENNGIGIRPLDPSEENFIQKIAQWSHEEWGTPPEKTFNRLGTQPNSDIVFHLVLCKDGQLISTGGLYHEVNILNQYPHLRAVGPWVAVLYTDKDNRGQGFGEMLLGEIEKRASEHGFRKIYLYTATAERLYKRCGWKNIGRLEYKNMETVLMEKEI